MERTGEGEADEGQRWRETGTADGEGKAGLFRGDPEVLRSQEGARELALSDGPRPLPGRHGDHPGSIPGSRILCKHVP